MPLGGKWWLPRSVGALRTSAHRRKAESCDRELPGKKRVRAGRQWERRARRNRTRMQMKVVQGQVEGRLMHHQALLRGHKRKLSLVTAQDVAGELPVSGANSTPRCKRFSQLPLSRGSPRCFGGSKEPAFGNYISVLQPNIHHNRLSSEVDMRTQLFLFNQILRSAKF